MRRSPRSDDITQASLGFGIAMPLLYYGVQLVAAPFFPDFSVLGTTASELGSDRSARPWILNAGAILTGIAALVGSIGLLRALRRLGAHPIVARLTLLVVAGTGLSSLWAGIFPTPDPRHGGHPVFLVSMLLLPFLLTITLWKERNARPLKVYLIATITLLIAMVPIMSGSTSLDNRLYGGLVQRFFALTIFPPIAVCAFHLARRIQRMQTKEPQ